MVLERLSQSSVESLLQKSSIATPSKKIRARDGPHRNLVVIRGILGSDSREVCFGLTVLSFRLDLAGKDASNKFGTFFLFWKILLTKLQ